MPQIYKGERTLMACRIPIDDAKRADAQWRASGFSTRQDWVASLVYQALDEEEKRPAQQTLDVLSERSA